MTDTTASLDALGIKPVAWMLSDESGPIQVSFGATYLHGLDGYTETALYSATDLAPLIDAGAGYGYGPWTITPASWIRPHPCCVWDWSHKDYDGLDDTRCGYGSSRDDCIAEIHRWEDEAEEAIIAALEAQEKNDAR